MKVVSLANPMYPNTAVGSQVFLNLHIFYFLLPVFFILCSCITELMTLKLEGVEKAPLDCMSSVFNSVNPILHGTILPLRIAVYIEI
jgi:hypothetical protein